MPDGYSWTLWGKITCMRDGFCQWTEGDTILASICVSWLLICVLMVLPAFVRRRR